MDTTLYARALFANLTPTVYLKTVTPDGITMHNALVGAVDSGYLEPKTYKEASFRKRWKNTGNLQYLKNFAR